MSNMKSTPSDVVPAPNGIHRPHHLSSTQLIPIPSSFTTFSPKTTAYTSLRDVLPATPSPPSGISPTHNASWHEIPIKNPLVKHAAWAYLQPMHAPPESDDSSLFKKLKSVCCEIGCWRYFSDVVLSVFVKRKDDEEEEDEEEDGDEGYCCGGGEKVD